MNGRAIRLWEAASNAAPLTAAFALPLALYLSTFDAGLPKDLLLFALAAAAGAAALGRAIETGRFELPVPRTAAALLGGALLAWTLLSFAWNPHPEASLFGGLRFAASVALFAAVLLGPASASFSASLSAWTLAAAAGAALCALAQSGRAAGTLVDPNLLGVFLGASVPLGLSLWADPEARRAVRAAGLAGALLCALGAAAAGSPPGTIALAAGCLAFAAWGHLNFRHAAGRTAVLAAWAAPLVTALASRLRDPAIVPRVLYESLVNLEVWKGSAAVLAGNLWTGSGAGSFNAVFPAHRPPELLSLARSQSLMIGNAHSEPLQVACELGLAGLALWAAVLGLVLVAARRDMSRRAAAGEERAASLMAGQWAALAALLAAGAVSSTLRSAAPGALVWLLAGSLAGLAFERGSAIVRVLPIALPPGLRRAAYAPLAAALAVGLAWANRFARSDLALNAGLFAAANKDWAASVDALGAVSKWHAGGVLARYYAGSALAELGGRDNLEAALAAYEEADAMSPGLRLASFRMAEIRKELGDWEGAERDLERFLAGDRSYAPAYALLAEVSATLGKPEAARDAALRLVSLDPNDPARWRLLGERYHDLRRLAAARRMFERADTVKDLAQARPLTPSIY